MPKKIKQTLITALTILAVIFCISLTHKANAGLNDKIDNFFDPEPHNIDIDNNPSSITGTYDIERLVINDGNNPILDTDDEEAVEENKGEMSIKFEADKNVIKMAFKMQIAGPILKDKNFAQYSFLYQKKAIKLSDNATVTIENKLSEVGIHEYDNDKLVWEIPYEGTTTIILILDKDSDRVKKIRNSKYLFL